MSPQVRWRKWEALLFPHHLTPGERGEVSDEQFITFQCSAVRCKLEFKHNFTNVRVTLVFQSFFCNMSTWVFLLCVVFQVLTWNYVSQQGQDFFLSVLTKRFVSVKMLISGHFGTRGLQQTSNRSDKHAPRANSLEKCALQWVGGSVTVYFAVVWALL